MRSRRLTLLPPVVYALIAVGYFWTFLTHPQRGVPGGPDGILYTWYFEWVEQSVVHLYNPLFSSAMNAPDGFNVMWNTPLFLLSVLFLPLTATIGPIPTVGLLMLLAPVVSASTCYFVLRHITGRTLGPAVAATIYGFGPFFAGQAGHLNLSFDVLPPLLLLFGHQLLIERRRPARSGIWFGVVLGLQLLLSEEVVVLCAIGAVIALAWLAVLHHRKVRAHLRDLSVAFGVAAGIALVIAGGPIAYQFFGAGAFPHGLGFKPERADLAAIVRPSVIELFASDADVRANYRFHSDPVENTGYLGWPLLLLLIGLCVWSMVRKATVRVLVARQRRQRGGAERGQHDRVQRDAARARALAARAQAPAGRWHRHAALLLADDVARRADPGPSAARLEGRALAAGVAVVVLGVRPARPSRAVRQHLPGPGAGSSPRRSTRSRPARRSTSCPTGATRTTTRRRR